MEKMVVCSRQNQLCELCVTGWVANASSMHRKLQRVRQGMRRRSWNAKPRDLVDARLAPSVMQQLRSGKPRYRSLPGCCWSGLRSRPPSIALRQLFCSSDCLRLSMCNSWAALYGWQCCTGGNDRGLQKGVHGPNMVSNIKRGMAMRLCDGSAVVW